MESQEDSTALPLPWSAASRRADGTGKLHLTSLPLELLGFILLLHHPALVCRNTPSLLKPLEAPLAILYLGVSWALSDCEDLCITRDLSHLLYLGSPRSRQAFIKQGKAARDDSYCICAAASALTAMNDSSVLLCLLIRDTVVILPQLFGPLCLAVFIRYSV